MDHYRQQWVVRFECVIDGTLWRCEKPVSLHDGFILEHELRLAEDKCIRALQEHGSVAER